MPKNEKRQQKQPTHREKFLTLMEEFGFERKTIVSDGGAEFSVHSHDKIRGYSGFVAFFDFNEDGSFDHISVVE